MRLGARGPNTKDSWPGESRATSQSNEFADMSSGVDDLCYLTLMTSMINMLSMINGGRMASMTIRDLDERLKARLRVQAAQHGRSMEDEARDILRTALSTERSRSGTLVDSIRARIEALGGVELEIAPREAMREPVNFDT